MLYITTRNNENTYTAHWAITEDCTSDGGRFIPFRIPFYSQEEILAFKSKPFNQAVADILNLFFSCRLSVWDVDFCIGRTAPHLVSMNHRITVAELWHNPALDAAYIIESLYEKLSNRQNPSDTPTEWVRTAVWIAIIFGIYGELLRSEHLAENQEMDISVPVDDCSIFMAAWYSRKMGLPINMIISTSNENSTMWDLIHRGVLNTAAESDALQFSIEKLIHATLGPAETGRYIKISEEKRIFTVQEELLPELNKGIFCSVAGKNRAESIINSVFRSNSYIIDPVTALCYGGLQDYRAKTGVSNITLLLSQGSPLEYRNIIYSATGLDADSLPQYVKP